MRWGVYQGQEQAMTLGQAVPCPLPELGHDVETVAILPIARQLPGASERSDARLIDARLPHRCQGEA